MLKLYVGNLNFDATEEDLRKFFEEAGEVQNVNVIKNKYNNKSKGFAFVEMVNDEDGKKAIENLNGKDLMGRGIVVAEARPPQERDDRPRSPGGNRFGGPRPDHDRNRF